MKIIICGAGQVGWQIARHLSGERNDVTVIDNNGELVRRATESLDVQGVEGFASHPDVLDRAGARDADLLIAATYSDEVNMVTCQVAHSVFRVPRKIARLRSSAYLDAIYSDLYRTDHLPIDVVISPEREVAEAALARLRAPSTFEAEDFLDGRVRLLGLVLDDDCPVLNTPLRQLNDLFSSLRAIVAGVRREGRLFAPEANDQLFEGDQIYIFSDRDDVERTLEIFGKETMRPERVVIIGGGNVGLTVARSLETGKHRVRTKIIESNRERAEVAADVLERTIVLHGDGLSSELLEEAAISRADAVLTLTHDDKVNILAAVRAKQAGAKLVVSLVNDPTLVSLMAPLDIDAYINPRSTTVSTILRHVRHGRVRDIYSIGDAEAEVIEAQILPTSSMSGKIIRDIDLPEGALIGMVMKDDNRIVKPNPETRIEEGDIVCIFALTADVPEVERLLQVAIDFF
ncbi:Trk system potassium transporter TrkA [Paracoccus aerodenitrificans]|uniref:Trk system potassium transporter TrkA n=1 Tax=Paracoccus aerodenitrificans TaxID=3017781 RepID=UPI0022F00DC5|nr:Trk system potassium transporter TrkA [Paracoccus aerodenitrificans]WBU64532.1 Trk system potassium transporter TrkA [Paracoccus aerodenitrificans]